MLNLWTASWYWFRLISKSRLKVFFVFFFAHLRKKTNQKRHSECCQKSFVHISCCSIFVYRFSISDHRQRSFFEKDLFYILNSNHEKNNKKQIKKSFSETNDMKIISETNFLYCFSPHEMKFFSVSVKTELSWKSNLSKKKLHSNVKINSSYSSSGRERVGKTKWKCNSAWSLEWKMNNFFLLPRKKLHRGNGRRGKPK